MRSTTFIVIIFSLLSFANTQPDDFEAFIATREKAVQQVASTVERALNFEVWCANAASCSSPPCALFSCNSDFGTEFKCTTDVVPRPCAGNLTNQQLCAASENPQGSLINFERPVLRTPRGFAVSSGDGEDIVIPDLVLRRDICALKSIEGDMIGAYEENDLKFWLYAGTANRAFSTIPSSPRCRDKGADDPLRACGYDPTVRPWYVTAASGPKDLVFLFDRTALTGTGSKLRTSLRSVLQGLDRRDYVAVVAYGSDKADILAGQDGLRAADADFIEGLRNSIEDLSSSGGSPNITLAFQTAFDLLRRAEVSENTSNCSKLVVLLSGNDDKCFESCAFTQSTECTCVRDLEAFINAEQNNLSDSASIISFSENQLNNGDRLARTIVCDRESSGIWREVLESDTETSAMSTFLQFVAASLYEEEPKVFFSQIYEDNGGLGEVFTLAVPIYERSSRQLLAVAGSDVTLGEVTNILNNEDEARQRVGALSQRDRSCPENIVRDSCALQTLRSQPGSQKCAPFLPKRRGTCYKFGDALYARNSSALSFSDALTECAGFGGSSKLARVDTIEKNEVLSGLYGSDGSWIGLKAEIGGDLLWTDGDVVNSTVRQFGFDETEALATVHGQSNGPACVTADRRGIKNNWNVESCSARRGFICEIDRMAAESGMKCEETVDINEEFTKDNVVNEIRCDPGTQGNDRRCTEEQKKEIENANPLCKQVGNEFSEEDRVCCGGRADPNRAEATANNPSESSGLPTAAIVSILVGAALVALVIIGLLALRARNRRRVQNEIVKGEKELKEKRWNHIGNPDYDRDGILQDPFAETAGTSTDHTSIAPSNPNTMTTGRQSEDSDPMA